MKPPLMKLALTISGLSCGGSERQLSGMANYWARKGWQITLITFSSNAQIPFYPLHPTINHVGLSAIDYSISLRQALARNIVRLSCLRRTLKRIAPQAVLSFGYNVNVLTIMATRNLAITVIRLK